jgi:hypothetical protein
MLATTIRFSSSRAKREAERRCAEHGYESLASYIRALLGDVPAVPVRRGRPKKT